MKKYLISTVCCSLCFFCASCIPHMEDEVQPVSHTENEIHPKINNLQPTCNSNINLAQDRLIFIRIPSQSTTFDKENCPKGKGFGEMIYDERCLSCKNGEKILKAPNGKGIYCCPNSANSLAWNGEAYQCCGDGFAATVVPERDDSICCPKGTKRAFWIKSKGSLFYTCNNE